MNRQSIYENSVNDLLKAYNSGALQHGNITTCATGTILQRTADKLHGFVGVWAGAFMTEVDDNGKVYPQLLTKDNEIIAIQSTGNFFESRTKHVIINLADVPKEYKKSAEGGYRDTNLLISESGYTKSELANIEYAFEAVRKTSNKTEKWIWNGLIDVLNVLKTIHEVDNATFQVTLDKFIENPNYKVKSYDDMSKDLEEKKKKHLHHIMEEVV